MGSWAADNIGAERRRAPRVSTRRYVVFASGGLLQEGTAVDVSTTGMRVHTPRPERVGAIIDADVAPSSAANHSVPITTRGTVVHVDALDAGQYAMGVRLDTPHPPRTTPHLPEPYSRGPAVRRPSAQAFVGAMPPGTLHRHEQSRRWRWTAVFLFFVLLGLGLLAVLLVQAGRRGPWPEGQESDVKTASVSPSTIGTPLWHGGSLAEDFDVGVIDTAPPVGSGAAEDATPMLPAASPGDLARARPPERFSGMQPGAYQPLAAPEAEGDRTSGPASPEQFDSGDVSDGDPRTRAGGPQASNRLAGDNRPGPMERQGREGDLSEPFEAFSPDDVRVTVSRSAFTLTLFVKGEPVRRFPVGVGKAGATPTGDFRIANKVTDPEWFDGAQVVGAGDPRNPLGNRWMGLSAAGTLTGYGLHPTSDPRSIGRAFSEGCVRLRPQDAETLFRVCPVGTPVEICL